MSKVPRWGRQGRVCETLHVWGNEKRGQWIAWLRSRLGCGASWRLSVWWHTKSVAASLLRFFPFFVVVIVRSSVAPIISRRIYSLLNVRFFKLRVRILAYFCWKIINRTLGSILFMALCGVSIIRGSFSNIPREGKSEEASDDSDSEGTGNFHSVVPSLLSFPFPPCLIYHIALVFSLWLVIMIK